MKKVGDIFKELGFNENAPESAKRSLLKHLMFEARRQERIRETNSPKKEEQLSFEGLGKTNCNNKKIS